MYMGRFRGKGYDVSVVVNNSNNNNRRLVCVQCVSLVSPGSDNIKDEDDGQE